MSKKHSSDAQLVVSNIDKFVSGESSDDKESKGVHLTPTESLIDVYPFRSRSLSARVANKLFSPFLKAVKKSFSAYFTQNDIVNSHLISQVDMLMNKTEEQPDINQIFDQKIYEIEKLNDRLKSELMAEINKDISPLGGKQKKLETKIINTAKYRSLKKLNIGSGSFLKDGYANIDHREIEGVDIIADIGALPYEAGSIDEIFSSHVAEHFTERKLKELLKYWYTLLNNQGAIVLIVPDIEAMTRQYVKGDITWDNLRQVILGGQDYNSDYHFNAFSTEYVERVAKEALPEATFRLVDSARKNGECLELEVRIEKKA